MAQIYRLQITAKQQTRYKLAKVEGRIDAIAHQEPLTTLSLALLRLIEHGKYFEW
jgi:hypothetical protein